MEKNKKKSIIIALTILFIVSVSLTFAYFTAQLSGDNKTTVKVSSKVQTSLVFNKGDNLSLELGIDNLYDGAGNVISVTNPSVSLSAPELVTEKYSIYFNITNNTFVHTTDEKLPEMILTILDENNNPITSIEGLTYVTSGDVSGFDVTDKNGLFEVLIDDDITADNNTVTKDWFFTLTFINLDSDQVVNSNKFFDSEILFQQDTMETESEGTALVSMILEHNGGVDYIESKPEPDFSSSTVEDGMFATEDNYGTTYYYRGENVNNKLSFAGYDWNIVRINGDGTIRIVLSASSGVLGLSSSFNSNNDSYEYSGYMYTLGEQHGLDNDSTIKINIDRWYEENLKDEYSDYLADATYCYNRISYTESTGENLATGVGTQVQYSKSHVNLRNNNPSLLCDVKADYYTVNDVENGNGALTYPVALLTSDELVYAGESLDYGVRSYYRVSHVGTYHWCGTPSAFTNEFTFGFATEVEFGGLDAYALDFNGDGISADGDATVVVNLKADTIVSGTGTASDYYVVE